MISGKVGGFKHVRCNPDVAPRLTSGGYEDKVDVITPTNILLIGGGEFDPSRRYSWCYYPNQHIAHRGWRNLIPHGDIVGVITPIIPNQHIVQSGWRIWTLHEDKVDDSDDGDDDDDHGDCKCGATSRLGRTCFLCSTIWLDMTGMIIPYDSPIKKQMICHWNRHWASLEGGHLAATFSLPIQAVEGDALRPFQVSVSFGNQL